MASGRPYGLTLSPEFEAQTDKISEWWTKNRPRAKCMSFTFATAAVAR